MSKARANKKPSVQSPSSGKTRQDNVPQPTTDINDMALLQPAQSECLVVAQYRNSGDLRFRNAVVRASTRIKQYGGRILGIADQFLARRWYESDTEWNQHDFLTPPTGVQIFSVPIRFLPNWNEKRTFLWMEFEGVWDKAAFQNAYVNPMTSLMDSRGVDHGLVFLNDADSMKLDRLKDCWVQPGSHLCLSMLGSEDDYEKLRNTDEYKKITQNIHCLCRATSLLFTIDPKIS